MKIHNLTVKVTSQDGSWESAKALAKQIESDPDNDRLCDELNVDIVDVWRGANMKNAVVQKIGNNSNNHSPIIFNQQGDL